MSSALEKVELKCIEIILNSITETSEMIVGNKELKCIEIKEQNKNFDENLILLGITGQINGELIFGITETALKYIASKMTGMEITEIDELATSSMVEYINMVSGSATIKLVDYFDSDKLKMSPPVFLRDKEINLGSKADIIKTYKINFEKNYGIEVTIVLINIKNL